MQIYFSQQKAAAFLSVCTNTFTKYIRDKYPPDRVIGRRYEWHIDTLNKIKNDRTAFDPNQKRA